MTIFQEPIKAAIWHCLNHYAYTDAIFLAERLLAEVGSNEALFLLATSYYRSGKPKVAMLLLDRHEASAPQCKLLYAQCAWEEKEYAKVERVLTAECGLGYNPSKGIHNLQGQSYISSIVAEIQTEYGESACFALSLLGRTYLRMERPGHAEQCLLASLKLNPFLWVPFERMCQAGLKPDPQQIFSVNNLVNLTACGSHLPTAQSLPAQNQSFSSGNTRGKTTLKEARMKTNAMDTSNVLRTRQSQNLGYLPEQQPLVPVSVTPTSVFSIKSGVPTPVGKSQAATAKSSAPQIHVDHMVTPPQTKADYPGVITTSGSLKQLPSSAFSHKDSTIITTPGSELLRSAPTTECEWDGSLDAITNSISRRSTRTQQRIGRRLVGGPTSLSPLTPSFGILPLADTPSPVTDRGISTVTPVDTIQLSDAVVQHPVKKMITRQSRKPHSAEPGLNSAVSKLHFSSENRHRPTSGSSDASSQSSTPSNQSVPVRRSTRIFANTGSSIKENNRNAGKSKHSQSKAILKKSLRTRQATTKLVDAPEEITKADLQISNEKQGNVASSQQALLIAHQKSVAEGLMGLLRDMAQGYLALCQYECKSSVLHFNRLPAHQRGTGWVLSVLGRAHFELTEYNEAESVFKELRVVAPHYMQGLEIYSTTLWHLQRDVELSALAHDMQKLDRLCPETWCAIGNCFSLQRDHSTAATFFRRAIQLDPECSYAYTLLGHETSLADDLDGALACYRNAVRWNPRHYNAWYGIGTIYYKQEKFKIAEIHFRKALSINPHNSVLLCHIGIVQHALRQTTAALRTLDTAVKMEPRNPLCKFHRANVLIAAEHYTDAANELIELREIVPKESLVHFLLGKVYKKLNQNHLAVISFSWAMDLDPKGANNQIKEAIDKQHISDDPLASGAEDSNDESMLGAELLEQSSTDFNGNATAGSPSFFASGRFHSHSSNRTRGAPDSDSESL